MEIKTKFNVHDEVYLMRANKVACTRVVTIHVFVNRPGEVFNSYGLECQEIPEKPVPEYLLYSSKEELLAAL